MIVLVLAACPAGLRGQLTRWLLEISPGVFVGRVSTRVRDLLWERAKELARDGRAIMVFSAKNEQKLDFYVHRSDWIPVDRDGVRLMLRPAEKSSRSGTASDSSPTSTSSSPTTGANQDAAPRRGWSNVSRRRRAAWKARQDRETDES